MVTVTTYDVLGVRVSALNPDLAFSVIAEMVCERKKGYVCVAPVSTIVEARQDPAYCKILNAAAMVTPDGMPIAWLGQRRAGPQVSRTYGPDLMLKVCGEGQAKKFRHFFYGGTLEICDKLEQCLKARFPDMIVAGKIAPLFMPKAEAVSPDVAAMINEAKADILWVGLGAPKQDHWMVLNREVLTVPVLVGIGAAFDFHAGVKPQAPGWMRRSGLEWLFRLLSEPRRLWKRYLIGNTLFIWWLLTESVFRKVSSK